MGKKTTIRSSEKGFEEIPKEKKKTKRIRKETVIHSSEKGFEEVPKKKKRNPINIILILIFCGSIISSFLFTFIIISLLKIESKFLSIIIIVLINLCLIALIMALWSYSQRRPLRKFSQEVISRNIFLIFIIGFFSSLMISFLYCQFILDIQSEGFYVVIANMVIYTISLSYILKKI